jgi:hypothetical protein
MVLYVEAIRCELGFNDLKNKSVHECLFKQVTCFDAFTSIIRPFYARVEMDHVLLSLLKRTGYYVLSSDKYVLYTVRRSTCTHLPTRDLQNLFRETLRPFCDSHDRTTSENNRLLAVKRGNYRSITSLFTSVMNLLVKGTIINFHFNRHETPRKSHRRFLKKLIVTQLAKTIPDLMKS